MIFDKFFSLTRTSYCTQLKCVQTEVSINIAGAGHGRGMLDTAAAGY